VDDEPGVLKAVSRTLEQAGLEVTCFTRAAECLEKLTSQTCDLLITDVKMPDMSGMELLQEARHLAPWLPVLVITGYGDIPMAVTAVRNGAVDFIEKPLEKESFLQKVKSILAKSLGADSLKGKPLTRTEMRILKLVYHGKNNKEIARAFGRSVRTVEDHRRHIMRKLDVHSPVELAKRVTEMGLF
jgi:two-component system response regulator FixJ